MTSKTMFRKAVLIFCALITGLLGMFVTVFALTENRSPISFVMATGFLWLTWFIWRRIKTPISPPRPAATFAGVIALIADLCKKHEDQQTGRNLKAHLTAEPPSPASTTSGSTFRWPSTGAFMFDIVGESYYQSALKALAGEHGDREPQGDYEAVLIPDDGNEHDDKAVRVEINGQTVGHLSSGDARSFRRRLGAKQLKGQRTACGARIVGGWVKKTGERVSYGVQLNLKTFD